MASQQSYQYQSLFVCKDIIYHSQSQIFDTSALK